MYISALHSVKSFGSEERSDGGGSQMKPKNLLVLWQHWYFLSIPSTEFGWFFVVVVAVTTSLSLRQSIFGSPKNEGIGGGTGQRKKGAAAI